MGQSVDGLGNVGSISIIPSRRRAPSTVVDRRLHRPATGGSADLKMFLPTHLVRPQTLATSMAWSTNPSHHSIWHPIASRFSICSARWRHCAAQQISFGIPMKPLMQDGDSGGWSVRCGWDRNSSWERCQPTKRHPIHGTSANPSQPVQTGSGGSGRQSFWEHRLDGRWTVVGTVVGTVSEGWFGCLHEASLPTLLPTACARNPDDTSFIRLFGY